MTNQPVRPFQLLFAVLALIVSSAAAADDRMAYTHKDTTSERVFLPGFTRPSLANRALGFVDNRNLSDYAFSLNPGDERVEGQGSIAEPAVVDNLFRFRF